MKAEAKGQKTVSAGTVKNPGDIKKIIFACDAGMGSSAMGATKFRNRIKAIRPDIVVKNTSVDNIPADCDIAVVQTILADRARKSCPTAQIVEIGNFLADPALDNLFMQISTGDTMMTAAPAAEDPVEKVTKPDVFTKEGILLNQKAATKEEAIRQAGQLLVDRGCVDPSYIDAMLEREKIVTTYMGMGLAIPHGTTQAKGTVKKTGIVFVQYPDGVPFGDEKAQLVFGIAGIGDEHLDMLAKVATALDDEEVIEKMKTTNDVDWILKQLS
jgi:PTS system mannitol-specific IIC component